MPAFQYKAMDTQGKSHQGILEADSARLIRQQLRDKNLLPVEVSPVQKTDVSRNRLWQKGVGAYDLALITRQLSVLLAASIPIEQALQAIAKQSEKPHVKALMHGVRGKVLEGYSLASALQDSGNFPAIYIATIHCGKLAV